MTLTLTDLFDALILGWLIGTWFYEGHHRRCSVVAVCPKCGSARDVHCDAGAKT